MERQSELFETLEEAVYPDPHLTQLHAADDCVTLDAHSPNSRLYAEEM